LAANYAVNQNAKYYKLYARIAIYKIFMWHNSKSDSFCERQIRIYSKFLKRREYDATNKK